jgi:hypothetical protein
VYNWEVKVRETKTKGSDAWTDPDDIVVNGRRDFGSILKKIRYKVMVVSYLFWYLGWRDDNRSSWHGNLWILMMTSNSESLMKTMEEVRLDFVSRLMNRRFRRTMKTWESILVR